MVEALRNSLSSTITSTGHNYQNHSYRSRNRKFVTPSQCFCCRAYPCLDIKTNRRCARISGLNMVSVTTLPMMDMFVRSTSTDDPFIVPCKVESIEFGSNCEEENILVREEKEDLSNCEEENILVREEKEDFDACSLEKKRPPWGNLAIQESSGCQTGVVSKPSRVSQGTMTRIGNKLHFLEERDTEMLSKRILRLSRSNKVVSALELYRSMEFSGLRPNLHACNSFLSCLLRNEMLDEALRIFESMKENEMTTGHTYSLMLKAIAGVQGCDVALDVFEELVGKSNFKKDFDVVVYNTMISVCGKVNNWVHAERIWRSLKDNGHIGTTVTYRLLVCIFVRCNKNELALDAYDEMVRNGFTPADDAMQAIIGACGKEGKWDLALTVFQTMLNSGLKPNVIACNALISSLGKAGKVKLAFKVYDLMESLGHTPDAYTWNALLGALYRANQYAAVLQLFERIQNEDSSAVNLHLYNAALMSCQRLGLWDRALQLLWQMEASGMSISTASYNLVIGSCEVARRPKVALQVYEHMVHQKHTPDTFTLLSLIRCFIWGSLWDEVEEILNRAAPDGSLYNAAIQGMCLRGKIDSANKLYMKMHKRGLKPDGKTRALMLQKLSKYSVRRANR